MLDPQVPVFQSFQSCKSCNLVTKLLLGGGPGQKNNPVMGSSMIVMALLDPLGAFLVAPRSPLRGNLVPLSAPKSIKLPILAPTCSQTSSLSIKNAPKSPSKLIFHRICDLPNLDFCNTLQCFSRFFNISTHRSKETPKAPK